MENESENARPKSPGAAGQGGSSSAPGVPKKNEGLSAEDWSLVALVLLSFVGFVVSAFSTRGSFQYWLVIAPLFALVSIFAAWTRERRRGQSAQEILKLQVLHWLVLPVSVYLIYRLEMSGRLDAGDAGVVALLAIAITTFLAGVHFDWRLGLVGVALGIGAFGAALVEEYFWLIGLAAVVAGGIVFWFRRKA